MDDMEGGSQTEEVSGYCSTGTPCSPMSTISDDYSCLPADQMFTKDEQGRCTLLVCFVIMCSDETSV